MGKKETGKYRRRRSKWRRAMETSEDERERGKIGW